METNAHNKLAADEVSVKAWFKAFGDSRRYLLSQWKLLALVIVIGGALGIAYAILKKPVYTAQCTFVLEEGEKGGGGLGQYSSLASMVGVDVGGGGGLFQGDNIIELYKSRRMIEQTLLSKAFFNGKQQLLINRYIHLNELDKAWKDNDQLKNLNFDIPKSQFTVTHDSIAGLIVDDINKNYLSVSKPDKKLTIISVKVKAADQLFAKAFTENLVSTVNAFYVQTKTKGITQNITLLRRQADSVRRNLNASISGTAAALDVYPNANPIMQSLRVPSQKRQIDVQASSAIYSEVVKSLEVAKSSLQKETPLIQLIDEPVIPLPKDKIGKMKAMFTGMLIGLTLMIIYLLSLRFYRKVMGDV
jgi:hypothetical protein